MRDRFHEKTTHGRPEAAAGTGRPTGSRGALAAIAIAGAAALALFAMPAAAGTFDDVFISYDMMRITESWVGGDRVDVDIYRHNTAAVFGVGPFRAGGTYQRAMMTVDGERLHEDGFMLGAGYDHLVNDRFHVDLSARVGLTDTDESTPYYAADTDFTAKLIWYVPDGIGDFNGRAFFPSVYGGTTVNRFGRVQAIGGAGVWHDGFNLHLTGFHAINGVADPMNPGDDFDIRFAQLKNSAVTLNAGCELGDYLISFRKNFPMENSGNDLHLGLEYRHFFDTAWGDRR